MIFLNALANIASTGYGGLAKHLTLELLSQGYDVRTKLHEGETADVQVFIGQLFNEYLEHPKVSPLRADKLVFLTMWEALKAPQEFIKAANELADLIIVPSQWNADVFRDNGVTTPIEVVPLGYCERDFPPLKRDRSDTNKPFTFLWQGFIHRRDRKGGNLVEEAFIDLVNSGDLPRDDVRLIMKSVPYLIPALGHSGKWQHTEERGLIRVIMENLPQTELLALLQEADVSIYPTSGEGFGLIPLEHMATGLPVFAPYATGMMEYLPDPAHILADENVFYPLKTKMMDALVEVPGESDPGQIPRPYYDDVRAKMKWAYENRDKLPEVGNRAARYAKVGYTYSESARLFMAALNKHFTGTHQTMSCTPIPEFTEAT